METLDYNSVNMVWTPLRNNRMIKLLSPIKSDISEIETIKGLVFHKEIAPLKRILNNNDL